MGDLSYLLKGIQRDMRDAVYNSTGKKTIFLCSRRIGKSFTMCAVAVEYCIRNPNSVVKLLFPKKKDAKTVARPNMRIILKDCPPSMVPEWKEADKLYVFPNGSEIQIAGTDSGSAESVRGSAAHLILCDEAGFHDYTDFTYIIQSILMPTLLTTHGKMIMASTPSKEPDHPFMTSYVAPARADGTLVEYDIYSNPLITAEDIEQIASEYPLGVEDPDFQREFLLRTHVASDLMVIPEFSMGMDKEVIRTSERPAYYDGYVSCDPAVIDLTGVLFAYYDFIRKKLVVVDEAVLGGEGERTLTTEDIADTVVRKEKECYMNSLTGEIQKPYMRVMDNNLPLLINDLFSRHGLQFFATQKDNKEDKVNKLRMMIKRGEIEINPRCKNLIDHIRNAKWSKNRKEFLRNKGNRAAGIKPNHADLLDALIYMVRNLQDTKNPYPDNYFTLHGDSIFSSGYGKNDSAVKEIMHKLMNIRKT